MTWMESGARRGSRHRCGQNGLFAGSVALFASAIGQIGEAFVITNTSATIQYVNRAFTRLAGYTSEEVTGKDTRILKSDYQDPTYYRGFGRQSSRERSGKASSGVRAGSRVARRAKLVSHETTVVCLWRFILSPGTKWPMPL